MATTDKDSTRTADNTTVSELFETVAPPREGTTGVHVVNVSPNYLLVIQGPEALHMTRLLLDYVDALHAAAVEKEKNDKG